MEGPSPACHPLVDLVKWMRSFLTWSSLRPLVVSHLWASLNAISIIFVVVVWSHADAAIELSSMYRVNGAKLFWSGLKVLLSSGWSWIIALTPSLITSPSGAVK